MRQQSEKTFQTSEFYDVALIHKKLEERGLTGEHLAVLTGLSITTVYQVLNGKATKASTFKIVGDELGIPYHVLTFSQESELHRAVRGKNEDGSVAKGRSATGGMSVARKASGIRTR